MKNRYSYKESNGKVVFALFVLVLFLLGSFVVALAQFGNVEFSEQIDEFQASQVESSEPVQESSEPQKEPEKEYMYYDKINMESRAFANTAIANGSLAVIDAKSTYKPFVDSGKLKSVYSVASHKVYGLSGSGLKMYEEAITNLDAFLVSFYDEVPSNGVIINKTYSPFASGGTDKDAELSTGYALQFSIYNSKYSFSSPEFGYLRDQAFRYGVIQRYPEGKEEYTGVDADNSIYRYIGVAHSWYMNLYKYSLEEYIAKIKTDKVLEFDSQFEQGSAYIVYYVPADQDKNTTYVPVPTDETLTYTVSGDGSSGFIVTVKISK